VRAVEIYKHLVVIGGTDLNAAETPPNDTTPSSSTADAPTIYSWNRKKSAVTRNESKGHEQLQRLKWYRSLKAFNACCE
jgi:hypothetical protein